MDSQRYCFLSNFFACSGFGEPHLLCVLQEGERLSNTGAAASPSRNRFSSGTTASFRPLITKLSQAQDPSPVFMQAIFQNDGSLL